MLNKHPQFDTTIYRQKTLNFWRRRTFAQKLALVILAIATLWIASGVFSSHHKADTTAAAVTKKSVRVETVPMVAHSPKLQVTGRTEALRRVDILAQTAGQIAQLPIKKGSPVKEGDVIVRLAFDGRDTMLKEGETLMKQRSAELAAQQSLFDQGFGARKALDEKRTQYNTAKATYERALAERDRAAIRAPFSGLLNDVPLDVSQAVKQGDKLAQVVVLDPLKVIGEVSERAVARLTAGQTVQVRTPDGTNLEGTLTYVSRSAQAGTRTFRVEASIKNADMRVPEGASVTLAIAMESAPASKIRRSSLTLNDKGVMGVRVVDAANKTQFYPVTIVDDTQDELWVTGLPNDARMIVVGQDFVIDGEVVTAVESNSK